MKIKLPFMIQDQLTSEAKALDPISRFEWESGKERPEVFLAGPVTARLAVLDFDEDSGQLHPSVPLDDTRGVARYDAPDDVGDRGFQAVSVFSTVFKTLLMYEAPDVLGRQVRWAFEGSQLLLVPRAGTWRNAFYERESRSLQFFSFPSDDGKPIHTSLSLDIVAHEAGHAILDAIAPHLYDSITPQSLALHEAIGDLTTLFASLDIGPLRSHLLNQTGGDIEGINAYTQVAEEFGFHTGRGNALRTLWNDATLDSIPDHGNFHDLSQVLSGAVYRLLVGVYRTQWSGGAPGATPPLSESGRALAVASLIVRRIALRGLDYLPPGEITFADYGRAVIAADAVANPDHGEHRITFAEILQARGIATTDALAYQQPPPRAVGTVDPVALVESDWYCYQMVNTNREVFGVPADTAFRIEPRQQVTKVTWRGDPDPYEYRQIILKVSWEVLEATGRPRWVRFGTTMVFDADSTDVVAVLTTNPEATLDGQAEARADFLDHLLLNDLLAVPGTPGEITAFEHDDGLRLQGSGRYLHLATVDNQPLAHAADRRRRGGPR